jgi:Clostripain family
VASNEQGSDARAAQPGKHQWTIMIFMGSAPLPDFADLSSEAAKTLERLREILPDASLDQRLNVMVQVHGAGKPRRHHVGHTPAEGVEVNEKPGTPDDALPLLRFVDWALETAKHDDDDYSMLVLWGHAYEFAIGPRKTGTGIDALDFAELAVGLEHAQRAWKAKYPRSDGKIDIVGFDSCDIATIEMAHQINRYAHYFLASQISIPLPGWPYDRIVKSLMGSIARGVPMRPHDLGAYIVRKYCQHYWRQNTAVSLTLINLEKAPDVFRAAQALATELVLAAADAQEELALIHGLFFRSQTWEAKPFVDVADLCLNLWRYSDSEAVVDAAAVLGDLLVRPTGENDNAAEDQPFVVEHGRNLHSTARLHGISLYAPHVAASLNWQDASYSYQKFLFAQDTKWGRFVEALVQPG